MTTFNTIPANLRTPGFYIEFDNSGAATLSTQYKALAIGAKAATGATATADTVYAVGTADSAKTLFGNDSQLHKMTKHFFANNNNTALSCIASADTTAVLAAIGDDRYHYFISALNTAAETTKLTTALNARYGGLTQNAGLAFVAKKGTYAELGTYGGALNSHLLSVFGYNGSTTTEAEAAAIFGAKTAEALTNDPARPLQTLRLTGFAAIGQTGKYSQGERNNLLSDGISTYTVSEAGEVRIERAITTYQTNAAGVADASYLDVTTPASLMYIRDYQRAKLSGFFPRHKLAKDGTNFPPGQAIVTPNVIRSTLVGVYEELISLGVVEGVENYKKTLGVSIPTTNPNRVDVVDKPDLVNQLMIYAAKTQFQLN